MKIAKLLLSLTCLSSSLPLAAMVEVSTLLNLDASGGVTIGPDGFLYVSDFGPRLSPAQISTVVYRVDPQSGNYTIFAEGFDGASGATFDGLGNFYQAEPRGNRVTRISPDGTRSVVADNLATPVGVQVDENGTLFVCNCANSEILKFDSNGNRSVLVRDQDILLCPNGLTMDDLGNLYAVTFGAGNVVKIAQDGSLEVLAELPVLTGGPSPVGLGHITWGLGQLFVTAIGTGVIYRVGLDGSSEVLAGIPFAFSNNDGNADTASFSKPNGIALAADGTRLFVNVSEPGWPTDATGLHPAKVRVISGF